MYTATLIYMDILKSEYTWKQVNTLKYILNLCDRKLKVIQLKYYYYFRHLSSFLQKNIPG